jgi:hypothetical protein
VKIFTENSNSKKIYVFNAYLKIHLCHLVN